MNKLYEEQTYLQSETTNNAVDQEKVQQEQNFSNKNVVEAQEGTVKT